MTAVWAVLAAVCLTVACLMWTVFCLAGTANTKPTPLHYVVAWLPLAVPVAAWADVSVAALFRR